MRIIISILFLALSIAGFSQAPGGGITPGGSTAGASYPDHAIRIDNAQNKDSLYIMLSDTISGSSLQGRGKWTGIYAFLAMVDSIIGGGGVDLGPWSIDGVFNDGGNIDLIDSFGLDIIPNDGLNKISFIIDTSQVATPYDLTLIPGDDWGSDVVNHDLTLLGNGTVGTPLKVDTSEIATQYDLTLIPGDDWGSDVVNHDNTLTGDGTVGTPLKVDTSKIATQYDLTLIGGGSSDHDWYEYGTTSPPNNIADEKFTEGELMIGTDDQPEATVHIKNNGPNELILEELGDIAEIIAKANSGGTTHPFQLDVYNKDLNIDLSGDYYRMGFIRVDKASGTVPGGTMEFHMAYDSTNVERIASFKSRETGGSNGLLDIDGGIRKEWFDSPSSSVTANTGQYGFHMTASGAKTLTLPALSSTVRGQVFHIFNDGASGNITVTPTGSDVIMGENILMPGESAKYEGGSTTKWVQN